MSFNQNFQNSLSDLYRLNLPDYSQERNFGLLNFGNNQSSSSSGFQNFLNSEEYQKAFLDNVANRTRANNWGIGLGVAQAGLSGILGFMGLREAKKARRDARKQFDLNFQRQGQVMNDNQISAALGRGEYTDANEARRELESQGRLV